MSFNSLPLQNNQYGNYNYLLNGNFDRLDAFSAQITAPQNWNSYKNGNGPLPTNGTGGTNLNITNSVISSTPLRGIRSWQITRIGLAEGEGYSSDFLISRADTNSALSISFDYATGSAYLAGDIVLYIYDITT
jgi:hypothetical protein